MSIYRLNEFSPTIAAGAYVAPNASLIGKVNLAENVTVWFGAVLRGDIESISIARNSNVQDAVVMHTDLGFPLRIGMFVTIGHQAMLHGCTVEDGSLVGIQAVILSGAVIGRNSLVGAGALITERKIFPERSLILGSPAKAVRLLTDAEIGSLRHVADDYVNRGVQYRKSLIHISHQNSGDEIKV